MGTFSATPFVDLDQFMFLRFSIQKQGQLYNLDLEFVSEDPEDGGLKQRTSIYAVDIPQMAKKINKLLATHIYDHLIFISIAHCKDQNGEIEFEFEFDDYGEIDDYPNDNLDPSSTSIT